MSEKKHEPEELILVEEDRRVETKEAAFEGAATQVAAVQRDAIQCEDDTSAYASAAQVGLLVNDTVVEQKIVEELIPVTKRQHKRRRLFLPLLLALLLLLILGSAAFASSTATITLTLEQHTLAETIVVSQSAQSLSAANVLSRTIPGRLYYVPGNHAHGWLTLTSSGGPCGCAVLVAAGTVFQGADGVSVMTESPAALGANCVVTVPAVALPAGPSGNIRARDITASFGKHISVVNRFAFGGGTNGYWETVIPPYSSSQVIADLTAQLNHKLSAEIKTQAQQQGLTLLSQNCYAHPWVSHVTGDIAPNAIISVSMRCSGQGYTTQGVLAQAEQRFKQQGQNIFGNDFALTGLTGTQLTNVVLDPKTGNVTAIVSASGQWTYQLEAVQKHEIASILAGKDMADAGVFLREQRGIKSASISTSGIVPTLPFLSNSITVVTR